METRKIALVIFLLGLIFLSLGVIVYVARQRGEIDNLQTLKLSSPTAPAKVKPVTDAPKSDLVTKDGRPITEAEITAKIEAMKTQIKQKPGDRRLTDDELIFLTSPRQAVISQLKSGK